ncbi:ATP-binding cassette domain-containing protein [Mariluticola halotolerans]|uniref:ATP-binding cassette domain-containing protein n=1 Tax=Mariluticola halotolerans TaxID=2909283 RepID=UPI0026E3286A|nr:ABC transporter ATP-binding protein [Mariluticola halotolerans]UJQ95487.1 ABC transporter ATP-binding protein [Mariluticola halotolerans]
MTFDHLKDAPPSWGASRPLLEITDLEVSAAGVTILDKVSLTASAGRTTGVVGESGSGKSMTVLAVMDLLPKGLDVVGGAIHFEGKDLTRENADQRRVLRGTEMAMVFQDPLAALNPAMRVDDQISEILVRRKGMDRMEARKKAVELLERVEVPEPEVRATHYPHQLSGGQRQRVVIAMALAGSPRLMLADEPTTSLDVTVQAHVLKLLRRLQAEEGLAMVLISHDLRVMAHYADDLVVMRHGVVVETGPARTVLANPQHEYTRHLIANVPSVRKSTVMSA